MPKSLIFNSFKEFVEHNEPFIARNPFMYFHLDNTIDRVLDRKVSLLNFFNVSHNNSQACVLIVENECLIYSFGFEEAIIPELSKTIEFNKFKSYLFFIMLDIIDALFTKYEVQFKEHKHRIYYGCNKLVSGSFHAKGNLQMAEINRLADLIKMGNEFVEDFYDGQKPYENTELAMISGINKGNLFQWVIDNELVGIAQIKYDEFEIPVLGFVYVNPTFQGHGIGSSIAFQITEGLLNQGHPMVRLMSDASYSYSNKVFRKIGYKMEGEYVVRYKEK